MLQVEVPTARAARHASHLSVALVLWELCGLQQVVVLFGLQQVVVVIVVEAVAVVVITAANDCFILALALSVHLSNYH